ncbi:unnamed protein product [Owenia fusiformis]|uniref:Uncharacterized protein n=1 Tax=Owenia fusiformis TaxID=6347 RepID=A0A8J1TBZ0_OWEFU|nr:unnamed protein product [Owenia fusiformis]
MIMKYYYGSVLMCFTFTLLVLLKHLALNALQLLNIDELYLGSVRKTPDETKLCYCPLLVKTKLELSNETSKGYGVYAMEDIPKGTQLTYMDCAPDAPKWPVCLLIRQDIFIKDFGKQVSDQLMEFIITHTFYLNSIKYHILELNPITYVNHCDVPNIGGYDYDVAIRDIKKGEELCEDYRTFDMYNEYFDLMRKFKVYGTDWKNPLH